MLTIIQSMIDKIAGCCTLRRANLDLTTELQSTNPNGLPAHNLAIRTSCSEEVNVTRTESHSVPHEAHNLFYEPASAFSPSL
jgi:hypothetical protein